MRTKKEMRSHIARLERQLHGWWATATRAVEIEREKTARAEAEAAELRAEVTALRSEIAELRRAAQAESGSERTIKVGDRVVPRNSRYLEPGTVVELRESGMALVYWPSLMPTWCWACELEVV